MRGRSMLRPYKGVNVEPVHPSAFAVVGAQHAAPSFSAARRFLLAILALLALTLAACGGGGGGGNNGPTEPPPPTPGVTFTPQGTAGANTIFLASGVATTASTLFLEVRANQVADLYGVAFDLTYPSTQLQFTRVTAGPLLGNGSVQAVASTPGTLIVGGTHLGGVPGSTGSGVVMTLEFTVLAAGTGEIRFSRNSALNSSGQPVAGVAWIGGSVTVIR